MKVMGEFSKRTPRRLRRRPPLAKGEFSRLTFAKWYFGSSTGCK